MRPPCSPYSPARTRPIRRRPTPARPRATCALSSLTRRHWPACDWAWSASSPRTTRRRIRTAAPATNRRSPRFVEAGADLVDVTLPTLGHDDELTVLHYEFAPGVDRYLSTVGDGAALRSLAQLQAWNREHAELALKFGQDHVDIAVAVDHERERDAYRRARERDLRITSGGLLAALGDDLECLIFPGAEGCGWAARAGWPSIVIPAGYTADNRRPVGVMLVSRPWTDARLLALGYAFEQAHPVRRTPAEINPAVLRRL